MVNKSVKTNLQLTYQDVESANYILEAISPDNLQAPEGIIIDAWIDGTILKVKVQCRKGFSSLISTLDDLLSCIQAAEKAISYIKK